MGTTSGGGSGRPCSSAFGLRYRKPHTLRHTFASILIQAWEPLTYVQRRLGHHSPAFTLEVYGHFIPQGDRRAVDGLDDATDRNLIATGSPIAESVRER
jgi:integrase